MAEDSNAALRDPLQEPAWLRALLITIRLEEYDYNGAVAIAALLLVASFVCLLAINLIPLLFEKKAKRNG